MPSSAGCHSQLLAIARTAALSRIRILKPYFQRDNYAVINKQACPATRAANPAYGARLHPEEILGTVDSLVSRTATPATT